MVTFWQPFVILAGLPGVGNHSRLVLGVNSCVLLNLSNSVEIHVDINKTIDIVSMGMTFMCAYLSYLNNP